MESQIVRLTWKEGVLALASTATALVAMEVGLRGLQYVRDGTDPASLLPGYRERTFQRSPFLTFGPRVNWDFERGGNPMWTKFNAMGLRLPGELGPPEPGETRVLALGGSTTENFWNDLGIHWPLAFECMLRAEGRGDVRLLNAGMSAYSTAHSLVRYQLDLIETRPDVVLIMHNVNDLTVTYHAAAVGRPIDPSYLVKYGGKGYTGQVDEGDVVLSRLASAVRSRLGGPSESFLPAESWRYDLAPGEALLRRNLRFLVEAVRDSGAVPVLLTMPRTADPEAVETARRADQATIGLALVPPADRFFADFDRFNETIRYLGVDEEVIVVDMARHLEDEPDTFVDMVHYSTEGVRRFAHALFAEKDRFLPPVSGVELADRVACEGVLEGSS